MLIVFFCFIFFILGIAFSKIKISIEKLEMNINNVNFQIKIGIFLFGFIKILGVKCNKEGIKILGKNFSYKQIFKLNLKELVKKNVNKKDIKIVEKLKIKIDFANFKLKVGTEDMFITVFLVTLISALIAELFRRKLEMFNYKKCKYEILPEFNKNEICYEGKTAISIKTISLGNLIFKN